MRWRLILDEPCLGPENMARDAFSLKRVRDEGETILRLYRWEEAVLSVGRNQKVIRQIDLAACRTLGIPLLRRMTGGRAVLHGQDLTYALAAPLQGGRFAPGIMAIYQEVCQVFLAFFRELGYAPRAQSYRGSERVRGERASAVCFSTPSAFEILLEDKKVVGSAQRLLPTAFLQHGSMPLEPQTQTLARIFLGAKAAELDAQMTDLHSMGVWKRIGREELAPRLAAAFARVMDAELYPRPWDAAELREIAALRPQYAYLKQDGG